MQKYPVDPLMTHDPLFRHGEDEQMSTEITKLKSVDMREDASFSWDHSTVACEVGKLHCPSRFLFSSILRIFKTIKL